MKKSIKPVLKRIFSVNNYFILQRNLSDLAVVNNSRIKLKIALANENDIQELISLLSSLDDEDKRELIFRLAFYKSGFTNCYIAKTINGEFAFLQWLIFPSINELVKRTPLAIYYPLNENQVNISNAFAFPKFRGFNLMAYVSIEILKIAKGAGYKNAITYIRTNNLNAINECIKLNFKLTNILREIKFFGLTFISKN